ncbi:hypothetical protein FGO68_gene4540 [Halteria grandinella]|uniref:Uncharacterized protein n=1 Tax=Halteria grandinella TaxID=5974 RepID=A0A8J8NZP9_HALGN|nr:hypothetical protein FGO68_gene4540 [Halteria grandinella]
MIMNVIYWMDSLALREKYQPQFTDTPLTQYHYCFASIHANLLPSHNFPSRTIRMSLVQASDNFLFKIRAK